MVSVCMASYNGEKFIHTQILSILSEIGVNDELIISDDSSTDGTIRIIKGIEDPRIRLLEGSLFRDPIRNFQYALEHAKGNYIFLADQDDVWIEGKYHKMKALLRDYDLVVSDSIIVDENLKEIHPSFFSYLRSGKGLLKNMIKSTYYGSCMAFRSSLLEQSLPFPKTREIGHDLWLGLVAEMTGRVLFYKEPLLLYRRHSGSFTPSDVSKSTRSLFEKAAGRLIMVKEVLKFYLKYICYGKRFSLHHNRDV